ncbi:MAG: bifunctional folylpolyglutamate synthase/dihydrofolate synthase [Sandaracinaceae bacterium]
MATYREAVAELYALAGRGVEPGLARMTRAVALVDHPERRLGHIAHIAGTNGKGSVAAMVATGVRGRSALFTSPHLHRLLERFRVEPDPISPAELARAWSTLRARLDAPGAPPLTFFETVTLLAFALFAERRPEVTVLEVGLGGRLDSTNVVRDRAVTIITRVHLDHQRFLGSSLDAIAREKAGILEAGVPAVVGRQEPEALAAIEEVARDVGAPLVRLGRELTMASAADGSMEVQWGDRRATALRPRLGGEHQRDNAALAVAALWALEERGLSVDVGRGVHEAPWPGRLERIDGEPRVLLDGAHNPDGARALAAYLAAEPPRRRVLLFAAMADKDWRAMLAPLRPHVASVVATEVGLARSEDPRRLAAAADGRAAEDHEEAFDAACRDAGPDGEVVVAGSLFLVAAVRARLLGVPQDPPIAM